MESYGQPPEDEGDAPLPSQDSLDDPLPQEDSFTSPSEESAEAEKEAETFQRHQAIMLETGAPEPAHDPSRQPAVEAPIESTPADVASPPPSQPPFGLWIALGLLCSVLFCGGFFLTLPAALSALGARKDWREGRRDRSLGKLKTAKLLTVMGGALGALLFVFVVILQLISGGGTPPPMY